MFTRLFAMMAAALALAACGDGDGNAQGDAGAGNEDGVGRGNIASILNLDGGRQIAVLDNGQMVVVQTLEDGAVVFLDAAVDAGAAELEDAGPAAAEHEPCDVARCADGLTCYRPTGDNYDCPGEGVAPRDGCTLDPLGAPFCVKPCTVDADCPTIERETGVHSGSPGWCEPTDGVCLLDCGGVLCETLGLKGCPTVGLVCTAFWCDSVGGVSSTRAFCAAESL